MCFNALYALINDNRDSGLKFIQDVYKLLTSSLFFAECDLDPDITAQV
jgi:hypothetical protein